MNRLYLNINHDNSCEIVASLDTTYVEKPTVIQNMRLWSLVDIYWCCKGLG